jgi:hypothetical protein
MPSFKHVAAGLVAGVLMGALAPAAHASLIGLYTFDNATNLGLDSSGNGNNLIGSWSAPTAVAGKFGGGVNLNGNSALVSASGTLVGLPAGNSSYTIASWINATTAGGDNAGGIVGWGNYGTTNQVVAFRMNGNTALHNYWWDNDLTANAGVDLTVGSGADGWHFVAATFDAVTGVNDIYVDGVLRANRTAGGLDAGSGNFAIGKTVNNEFFNGQMDNTAIFNQALTQAQLQKIASNDFSQFTSANVPEPESLLLVAIGMAGLVFGRRRRARSGA